MMHWINAVAIFIMIGSGWKIYNDDVIFGWLHFPDALTIGKWAQHGLQWHFFGMWIFVLNGLAYLGYGIATGRFRRKLFPISIREIFVTVGEALRFRLGHDDLTHYNAVQKILYLGVILIGICIVISGLALWKPVQFSELAALFGSFQTIRLVHFLCMSAIVAVFGRPRGVGAFGAANDRRDADRRARRGRHAAARRAGACRSGALRR